MIRDLVRDLRAATNVSFQFENYSGLFWVFFLVQTTSFIIPSLRFFGAIVRADPGACAAATSSLI